MSGTAGAARPEFWPQIKCAYFGGTITLGSVVPILALFVPQAQATEPAACSESTIQQGFNDSRAEVGIETGMTIV